MEFQWIETADRLPRAPGAYLLWVTLREPAALPAPRFAGALPPGDYIYVGSAHGPGGIRARCARHLRREKTRRWHIDWLTTGAARIAASAQTSETECALVETLLSLDGASVPVPGFGSTDCRRCAAHLLALAGETEPIFQGSHA